MLTEETMPLDPDYITFALDDLEITRLLIILPHTMDKGDAEWVDVACQLDALLIDAHGHSLTQQEHSRDATVPITLTSFQLDCLNEALIGYMDEVNKSHASWVERFRGEGFMPFDYFLIGSAHRKILDALGAHREAIMNGNKYAD